MIFEVKAVHRSNMLASISIYVEANREEDVWEWLKKWNSSAVQKFILPLPKTHLEESPFSGLCRIYHCDGIHFFCVTSVVPDVVLSSSG